MGNEKYLILLIAVFLLFAMLPVYAASSIEVSSPRPNATYNVGDNIIITGQISLDKDVAGAQVTFGAVSVKANKTIPIATKFYSFANSTVATFAQINKDTLSWAIPFDFPASDDWQISVKVYKEPESIVSFSSGYFSVSKSLAISVSTNSYILNLGELLEASGTVLDAQGTPAVGTATVYLDHSTFGNIFSDTLQITGGFVNFRYNFRQSDPAGNYTLSFKVLDIKGNSALKIIRGIEVSNKLALICNMPAIQFNPGDEFDIIGNLKNAHNAPVDNAPIIALVTFPEKTVSLSFTSKTDSNGNYAVKVQSPKLAQPGNYIVSIVADDSRGNTGSCEKSFYIGTESEVQVGLKLNSSSYPKNSSLGAELHIKNNGNVDLKGEVSLLIDNKEVKSAAFTAKKGIETSVDLGWAVSGEIGSHTISALLTSDSQILTQTPPQTFEIYIYKKPKPPYSALEVFVVGGIAATLLILFLKRKEIRDYMWHLEMKQKYGIGERRALPHFKKTKKEAREN